jgi:hypothetical protein
MPSLIPLSQICCRRPACICDRPSRFISALCHAFTYPFSVLIYVAGGGKNPLSTRLTRLFAVIGVQPLSESALGAIISEQVFWRRYLCTLSYSKLFRSDSQLALERANWRWNAECTRCREECFCSGDQVRCCSFVTPLTSHLTPHTSHLTPHTSHLTPHTSHLTPHTSHLTPHTSHLTPHTSRLTPHTSRLTPPTSHLTPHPLADCSKASVKAFSPPPAKANTFLTFAMFPKLSLASAQFPPRAIPTNPAYCA